MNTAHVQLNFALQPLEDPLSAAMAHTSECDTLHLVANDQHEVNLACALPDDAHEDDVISVNVTHLLARNARYSVEHTVTLHDLEAGRVNLVLSKIGMLSLHQQPPARLKPFRYASFLQAVAARFYLFFRSDKGPLTI